MASSYIQFGCGTCAPVGWRNFDASATLWIENRIPFLKPFLVSQGFPKFPDNAEYGDVIAGLPVKELSAKAVYCSHTLEHLTLEEFRRAIRNVYTYLEHGGIFRLVVPDLEYFAAQYLQASDAEASSRFMRLTLLGVESRKSGPMAWLRSSIGRSRHLWMWDAKGLAAELEAAGFMNVRRARFGDSAEAAFQGVEEIARWDNCLGMECVRP